MNSPAEAATDGVPGPRSAPPPPPPTTVPAGPEDDDLTDALEEAYWSVHDGAAASATVRQVLARLPRITALIGRMAWQAVGSGEPEGAGRGRRVEHLAGEDVFQARERELEFGLDAFGPGGELVAAGAADEEFAAEGGPQALQGPAHRRLAHVEPGRRAGDVAFLEQGVQRGKEVEVTSVTPDMRIATEEIFGPVVTVTAFSSPDEAVEIANASEYGLLAAVHGLDSAAAFRVARRLDVGMVFVNNYFRGVLGTPFGGTKHSGYGREHAIETLRAFTTTKTIRFPTGLAPVPQWRAVTDIYAS